MITIVIDCGASFLKGAVYDGCQVLKKRTKHTPPINSSSSIFDLQQIGALLQRVQELIDELSEGALQARLCLCNEMHGFILADKDGNPYTDYISWQKELSRETVASLQERLPWEERKRTGMALRNGLPVSNLFWLAKEKKLKRGLFFYTLGDYIIRIVSGKEPVCHPTNAAATGLYDLDANSWNHTIIDMIGAKEVVFPKIGEESFSFQRRECSYTVFPAIGDQQAALLGAGFITPESLSFNLGTGAQVSRLLDCAQFSDGYQVRPYFKGMYLKTIPHIPAGRALNVYFNFIKSILDAFGVFLSDEDIWRVILDAADNGVETALKIDLGFFENAVNTSILGGIADIEERNFSMNNLFYAVLKQMGCNMVEVSKRLEPSSDKIRKIIFSGGVSLKVVKLREIIVQAYPNAEIIVSDGDTLEGLYQYSILGDME